MKRSDLVVHEKNFIERKNTIKMSSINRATIGRDLNYSNSRLFSRIFCCCRYSCRLADHIHCDGFVILMNQLRCFCHLFCYLMGSVRARFKRLVVRFVSRTAQNERKKWNICAILPFVVRRGDWINDEKKNCSDRIFNWRPIKRNWF